MKFPNEVSREAFTGRDYRDYSQPYRLEPSDFLRIHESDLELLIQATESMIAIGEYIKDNLKSFDDTQSKEMAAKLETSINSLNNQYGFNNDRKTDGH